MKADQLTKQKVYRLLPESGRPKTFIDLCTYYRTTTSGDFAVRLHEVLKELEADGLAEIDKGWKRVVE